MAHKHDFENTYHCSVCGTSMDFAIAELEAKLAKREAALTRIQRTFWGQFEDPVDEIVRIASEGLE